MQRALNYEKYFNMTKEQLRASLARATQKEKSKMAEFFIDILGVDKSLNDKSLNDKSLNDKSLNDKSLNDKSLNDKSLNDKSLNDKSLNDKSLNGEILNDDEKSYPLDKVPVIQRARAGFAKLPKQEQERIRAKVRAQMGLE